MKYTIAVLALGFMLVGCQQDQDNKPAEKEAEQQTLIADKDKMAYALGSDMAKSIKRVNEEYKAVAMDIKVVEQGFIETLKEQGAMSDEEINQQIQIFQQKMRFAQQQKMQEMTAQTATKNAEYMATLEADGYTKTESGLYYKAIAAAPEGAAKPNENDTVKVHYTGKLIDGNQFDSSVDRAPFEFSLQGGVIQGWLEGVKLMSVGSKYNFVIPPELGYGDRANARIPAGSILVFDIELLEIVSNDASAE